MIDITSVEIDHINLIGYSQIANEYSDIKRLTTANFHLLSEKFFCDKVKKHTSGHSTILDLGCGRGYLQKYFDPCPFYDSLPKEYVVIDLSLNMLFQVVNTLKTKKICASSFSLPLESSSVDVIFSSLIASFLTEKAIKEISRVLKPKGSLIFSTPSKTWSDAIRDINRPNMAKFKTDNGSDIWVYSFTYSNSELKGMLAKYGLEIIDFEIATGELLLNKNLEISQAISEASSQTGIQLRDLPILQLVEAQKR